MPLNIDWQQILLHLLNFTILAFGLYFLLYRPVRAYMKKREDAYAEREEKTKKALDEAERKESEYKEKFASAEEEVNGEKSRMLAEVAALREEKLKSAQAEADKILKDAREKAREEHDRLIESANEDIADIVGSVTEKLVLKASTDEAYEQFLSAAERGEEHEKD